MNEMTIEDIIDRMGDRVTDKELGLPEGTLDRAATFIRNHLSDKTINEMDMAKWDFVVGTAIDCALRRVKEIETKLGVR